ncbi:MAG TPA: ABC-F family ATP-binding cassette domain-containing protein [Streptosporangiaceae bacterium]|nr:ABC-F family ATP-binding cassette domain-containing protein [Streptosporangiaceae bacterium]
MNIVNLEAAVKAYGTRVLLDHVSLGVAAGDRIGVVGRNGSGKTTLLAALAGVADLSSGRSTRARDAQIGYLPQSVQLAGTVREIVFGTLPEHEWAADARGRGLLRALLSDIDTDARAERLSGGERRRVALAALLRGTHDLLLLDEPTNHLDIEAIRWLAGYLTSYGRAFVVVTHDRWFLDEVCERTWEVADGQVHSYEGGYSAYVLARAERARQAAAQDQRRRNLLRKELAWLRRGPPARTSKPRFRIEAATALISGEPAPRDGVELSRLAAARLGKTVIDLTDVTVAAGGRILLDDVSWQLGPGDRVGVVGVNGSGKTTLLNLLAAGTLAGTAGLELTGEVVTGKTVRIGYLTQEPRPVDPGLRALEAAQQVRGSVQVGKGELSASQLLERLGLSGDRQWTPVAELSGGERRRLQLQMLLMAEPNVLLLDEPTNDLDIDTLTELEDLLDGFPGSIVVVSHDRYFLERVTDRVLALIDGGLAFLPGGVDEYLERLDAGEAAQPGTPPAPGASGAGARAEAAAGGRAGAEAGGAGGPAGSAPSAGQLREARKELARLDRQLERLGGREAGLHEELAEAAADYARLIELGDELRALQAEKAALEDRWLLVAEETAT